MIDLDLLRNTPFTVANILNVVANGTMFAIWLLTPYYLVTVRGLSTIAGGLMLGIAPLATAIAAPVAGRILGRVSTGRLSSIGLALEAAGLFAVAATGADTPLLFVAGAFALVGVGLGLFTVPNLLFVMGSIPRDRQGVAGALSQMMRMVGVVAGVAGATLLFDARRSTHVADLAVPADDPTAFVAAYRETFVVGRRALRASASRCRCCGRRRDARSLGDVGPALQIDPLTAAHRARAGRYRSARPRPTSPVVARPQTSADLDQGSPRGPGARQCRASSTGRPSRPARRCGRSQVARGAGDRWRAHRTTPTYATTLGITQMAMMPIRIGVVTPAGCHGSTR